MRIAAVVQASDPVVGQLLALPGQPQVRGFDDLYQDPRQISDYQPQLLLYGLRGNEALPTSALRLLQAMLPGLQIIIQAPGKQEATLRPELDAAGFAFLTQPCSQAELGAICSQLIAGVSSSQDFLTFAHGVCDEINNPLLLATGHLQLLTSLLDPIDNEAALSQLQSAQDGLQRIIQTMDKVRNASQAKLLDQSSGSYTVGELIVGLKKELKSVGLKSKLQVKKSLLDLKKSGHVDLLVAAVFQLLQVAQELSPKASDLCLNIELDATGKGLQFRLPVLGLELPSWQLPRMFEPYFVHQLLQGSPLGLNLYLLRVVALAHSGDAILQRMEDGSLEFLVRVS